MKERNNNSNDPEPDEREQMEVRLTALALGEASDFEAAELRRAMDADPKLAEYYRRVEITAGIVREAANQGAVVSGATAPRLSEERRNAILKRAKLQRTSFSSIIRFPRALPMGFAASLVLGIGILYWALFRGVGDSRLWIAKSEYTVVPDAPPSGERTEAGDGAYSMRGKVNSSETETGETHLAMGQRLPDLLVDELVSSDLQDISRKRSTNMTLDDSLAAAPDKFASALLGEDFGPPTEIEERSEIHSYQNLRIPGGTDALSIDTNHGDVISYSFESPKEEFERNSPLPSTVPKSRGIITVGVLEASGLSKKELQRLEEQSDVISDQSILKRKSGKDKVQAHPADDPGNSTRENTAIGAGGAIDATEVTVSVGEVSLSNIVRGQMDQREEAFKQDGQYRARREIQTKNEWEKDIGQKVQVRRYEPLPGIVAAEDPFSTFSLNVSNVSFQLAEAALEKGEMPSPNEIRSEEFLNAFNYHDPAPTGGMPLAFHWERARSPFHHNREFLRFSVQTASEGRERARPLNLVLLIDNSGSMERADRRSIVRAAVAVLADAMGEGDRISVVAFERTPHLLLDGVEGNFQSTVTGAVDSLKASGATHLEGGLDLAYEVAKTQFRSKANNRVVLLTDGAANLGEVLPDNLRSKVAFHRKLGIALDCFGIGADGLNDAMLEALSRNGDGRYGFLNSVKDVEKDFSKKLAGTLQTAASDVKVQVEFNPGRVESYRQLGYRRHQLERTDFRDDAVDAAEIGEAEAGNSLYLVSQKPNGVGPIATVRVRFRDPATREVRELSWQIPASRKAPTLREANPSLRLAVCATMFAERLAGSPYAEGVTPRLILENYSEVPESFPLDEEPLQLREMIERAGAISGR